MPLSEQTLTLQIFPFAWIISFALRTRENRGIFIIVYLFNEKNESF